jgi:hypothetical protein
VTDFIKRTFNGSAQLIIILLSAIGLIGTLISVYVNIHSNIAENRRSIDDIRDELNKFMLRTEQAQATQKAYDAEMRNFVFDADKDIRAAQRQIAEKLIDLNKK